MQKRSKKKVKDLVEMLQNPDNSGYIGNDLDSLEVYNQELADLENEDGLEEFSEEELEGGFDNDLEDDYYDEDEFG